MQNNRQCTAIGKGTSKSQSVLKNVYLESCLLFLKYRFSLLRGSMFTQVKFYWKLGTTTAMVLILKVKPETSD